MPWSLRSPQKVALRAAAHMLPWLPTHPRANTAPRPPLHFLQAQTKAAQKARTHDLESEDWAL